MSKLHEKYGYLKCQADIVDLLIVREKLLYEQLVKIKAKIKSLEGMERLDTLMELERLHGEQESLTVVIRMIFSLQQKAPVQ